MLWSYAGRLSLTAVKMKRFSFSISVLRPEWLRRPFVVSPSMFASMVFISFVVRDLPPSIPIYQAFLPSSSPPQLALRKSGSFRDKLSIMVRAEQVSSESSSVSSEDAVSRRIMLAVRASINLVYLSHAAVSFAAESKKGFLPVLDKKDGCTFYYPFGWQEVVIEGQDKVFKDVIEPLESILSDSKRKLWSQVYVNRMLQ